MNTKVFYSITKCDNPEIQRKGVGYRCGDDLLTPAISKKGEPYIWVRSDACKNVRPVAGTTDCFKGIFQEIWYKEVEQFAADGTSTGFEKVLTDSDYYIWYRVLD